MSNKVANETKGPYDFVESKNVRIELHLCNLLEICRRYRPNNKITTWGWSLYL